MQERGFTLIEMIVGLVVLGLLAMVMVPLIQMPATAYMEARNRTELQGQADLVRSKLEDDLRTAIPGSLRTVVVGGITYFEFMQAKANGRYRGADGGPSTCPPTASKAGLATGTPETCFTTIGDLSPAGVVPVPNVDRIVIDTMEPETNGPYTTTAGRDRKATISAYATAQAAPPIRQITIVSRTFPASTLADTAKPWPANRFYVIQQAVSYVCNPAAGTLVRRWGYAMQAAQPTAFGNAATALLSDRVSSCGNPLASWQAPVQGSPVSAGNPKATRRGQLFTADLELSRAVAGLQLETQRIWLQVPVMEQP